MPIVQINLVEGRSPVQKLNLIRDVTQAVVRNCEVRPDQVRILLTEYPPHHWAIGGELHPPLKK